MLLQTAELTKAATQAASNVTAHAGNDAFTSLSWLLNIVFGGALGLLVYKLIWKDKPVGKIEFDGLVKEVGELKILFAGQLSDLKGAFAERKKSADEIRLTDKLKIEQDFAAVAATLNRLADMADSLTTIMERVNWHGKEFESYKEQLKDLHEELKEVKKEIRELYRNGTSART
ncbi:hypothetical protein [Hymenobacter tenuis]